MAWNGAGGGDGRHTRGPSYADQLVMLSRVRSNNNGTASPAYRNPLFSSGDTRDTAIAEGVQANEPAQLGMNGQVNGHGHSNTPTPRTAPQPTASMPTQLPSSMASYEADVVEPFIRSLRNGTIPQQPDQQVIQQISSQMSNLYDFFKQLYDKDKSEIRDLSSALKAKDMQISKLAAEELRLRQAAEIAASRERDREADRERERAREREQLRLVNEARSKKTSVSSFLVLFLPYHLHPASIAWRFYAAWHHSWSTRRTHWLTAAWIMVFILAVGLLVGLLVPWENLRKTKFTYGPEVTNITSTAVSVLLAANRPNTRIVYAVVPTYWLETGKRHFSRRLLLKGLDFAIIDYSDLAMLTGLKDGAKLEEYAVACGMGHIVQERRNYTLTIASIPTLMPGVLNPECTNGFGMDANTVVPFPDSVFSRGRCLRCPVLAPGIAYDILIAASSGRRTKVKRLRFIMPRGG